MESSKSNEVIVYEEIHTSLRKTLFVHATLIFGLNLIASAFYNISLGVKATSLDGLGYIVGFTIPIFSIAVVVPLIISALNYLITKRKWNCAKLMWGLFIGLVFIAFYFLRSNPNKSISERYSSTFRTEQEGTTHNLINQHGLVDSLANLHFLHSYLKQTIPKFNPTYERFVLDAQNDENVEMIYQYLGKTVNFGSLNVDLFTIKLWSQMKEHGNSVYLEQINKYNQIINEEPSDFYAYFRRAFAKEQLKDRNGAVKDYDTAIILNPNFARAYFQRGICNLRHLDACIKDMSVVIEIDPNNGWAYYYRGFHKIMYGIRDTTVYADLNRASELGIKEADTLIEIFCQ